MGKHHKQNTKKELFLDALRIVFFAVLIFSIYNILKWYTNGQENKKLQEEISEAITVEKTDSTESVETKYKVDFEKLKQINNETVAWLKVNNTNIEYAVVKSEDNNYYLNHNFEKKANSGGWIFADYKNKFDGTDKNIVIYGHNMKDKSMFGTLENILKDEWYNNTENYILNFITEKEEQKYELFSVYKIENEDYYINTEFADNDEYENFIKTIKNRSIKDFNIEISSEDSILTLSTCADNNKYRVVLHARKIV